MKIKSKKWVEREAHKEWRKKVFERDNYTCQVCKSKPNKPHPHHIIPVQFIEFKYDIMNGITLCYQHHKVNKYSPHQHALWFYEWLKNEKPEQFKYLADNITT